MKALRLPAAWAFAGLLTLTWTGCGHLDLATDNDSSDPNRVVTGTVQFSDPPFLPQDAVLVVRVIDTSRLNLPPQVIASEEIRNPGAPPVPFRIEYHATDDLLRRGLNLEARVSYGGEIRLFNHEQVALTLSNASDLHDLSVESASP